MAQAEAGRRRRLTAVLLALSVAGLGAANWHLAGMEIDVSPLSTPERGDHREKLGSGVVTAELASTESLGAYPETTARPLFSATRRPPPKPEPERAPAAPPPIPDGLRLVGLMQNGLGSGRALVRAGEAQGTWISEGDTIEGWTVHRIGNDSVTLRTGRHVYELTLYRNERAAKADE